MKHLFWILASLFGIADDYVRMKLTNLRVQAFKEFMFEDKNVPQSQKDAFNGTTFTHNPPFIYSEQRAVPP